MFGRSHHWAVSTGQKVRLGTSRHFIALRNLVAIEAGRVDTFLVPQ